MVGKHIILASTCYKNKKCYLLYFLYWKPREILNIENIFEIRGKIN